MSLIRLFALSPVNMYFGHFGKLDNTFTEP